MTFKEKITIEGNIVKYSLKAVYNEDLTDDEIMEIESLHDYIKKIRFADIDFSANVAMTNGKPMVTEDDTNDTAVEIVLGKVAPKEYVLDENLNIEFSIDAGRIADSETNDILPTKALVSQGKIAVFQHRLKEKILSLLDEIRNEDNNFEQETEIII